VDKLLTGLDQKKPQGPDKISPRLLKELHTEMAPTLTIIFQKNNEHRYCSPEMDLKHVIITPALKKGQSQSSNNRQISLTCITSKLMEHIIVSNMRDYLDTHSILCHQQHGFRSGHSCETQRIGFLKEIADS